MPVARTQKKAAAARSADCVCDVCDTVVSRAPDLKRHMLTHRDEKPFKCMLPLVDSQGNESPCPYAGNQKVNLKTHQRSRLHANVTSPCGFEGCTYESTDPSGLSKHRKRRHNIVPKVLRAIRAPKLGDIAALGIKIEEKPVASRSKPRRLSSHSPSSSIESELDFWSHSSTTSSSRTSSPSSCSSSPRPLTQEATFIIEETSQPDDLGGFLSTPQSFTLGQYDLNVAAEYQMRYNAVTSVPYSPLFCDEPYFPPGYWSAPYQSVPPAVNHHPDTQEIDQWRSGIVRSHRYPY
ncbi:hypothetical protein D9611_011851 [Ephemerocybe angulata]|uniref:C2H2-type domain-containing protein n=1 Tax=Ephemerocybe angulata TaxID=980116 RepID=A0A8H5FBX2_9AGAR|nr:hypothetical protein D9611_011851 [Tulosesus angulatus]